MIGAGWGASSGVGSATGDGLTVGSATGSSAASTTTTGGWLIATLISNRPAANTQTAKPRAGGSTQASIRNRRRSSRAQQG